MKGDSTDKVERESLEKLLVGILDKPAKATCVLGFSTHHTIGYWSFIELKVVVVKPHLKRSFQKVCFEKT